MTEAGPPTPEDAPADPGGAAAPPDGGVAPDGDGAGSVPVPLLRVDGRAPAAAVDAVAVEEPMEVRVVAVAPDGSLRRHAVAVTMRTPGRDTELAAGFLVTEGVLHRREDLASVEPCAPEDPGGRNVVNVRLRPGAPFDPGRLSRNVYTSSSCGVCGKASLELVRMACPPLPPGSLRLSADDLHALPARARRAQPVFARTGGLHAAALFDGAGRLRLLREDVGRHNAVDKVVGALFLAGNLPAGDAVLLVSGRASFELVQKALLAGIPVLAAVGAPSSLAVETAREFGMTLVGFLRDGRFNVYAGESRIRFPAGN